MRHALLATLFLALAACPKEGEDTVDTDTDTDVDTDTDTDADTDTEPTEDCEFVELDEGADGTMTIDAAGEDDVKHHWDMPAGKTKVIGHVTWSNPDWKMALDLGEGFCPHSGTSHGRVVGEGGALDLELVAMDVVGTETFDEGDQWFIHMGEAMPINPDDGETCDYTFTVELCAPIAE
jgi:hypothetical protein